MSGAESGRPVLLQWARTKTGLRAVEAGYLVALGVVACLIAMSVAPAECTGPDAIYYLQYAREQISQTGFWQSPSAFDGNFWAMAYPTALSLMLRITGDSVCGAVQLQAVLASTLVVIPWLLTRHLGLRVRLLAPALLALNPGFWWMSTSVGYEVLLAGALGGSLTCAWLLRTIPKLMPRATQALALLSGLLLAVSILTQSKAVVVAPVIAYLLLASSRRHAWLGGLGLALGLFPWMLRNLIVLGTASPFTNNADFNLWVGNSAENPHGGSYLPVPMPPNGLSFRQGAIEFVLSQPEKAMELLWSKASRLLLPVFIYPESISPGPASYALHLWAGLTSAIIACAVVIFLGARLLAGPGRVPEIAAPAVAVGLFYASHLPFIAEPRFMTAVLPVSCAVCAATLIALLGRMRRWVRWRSSGVIQRVRSTPLTGRERQNGSASGQ